MHSTFRKTSSLSIVLLLAEFAHAQLQFQSIRHDYGTIPKARKLMSEFVVTNTGATDEYILRLSGSRQFSFVFMQEVLKPGQSDTVKLLYAPQQKGAFSEKIQVYLSSPMEPITLSIKGVVGELDPDALSICYSFKYNHPNDYQAVAVTGQKVTVIDKKTGKPIPEAFVQVFSLSDRISSDYTKADGTVGFILPPNLYELRVRADFYTSATQEQYMNKTTTDVVIALERNEDITDTAILQSTQVQAVRIDTVKPLEVVIPKVDTMPVVVSTPKDTVIIPPLDNTPKPELLNGLLNPDVYAPSNVVFLLDISGSMQQETRLPSLKKSMKALVEQLRHTDKITILAYNESIKIVFPTGYVTDKAKLFKQIDTLKAGGLTATDRGLKLAYEMALSGFIPGGNNQVILATDGIFGVTPVEKTMINKAAHALQPVILSVMGFGLAPVINEKLANLAAEGNGSFFSGRGPGGMTALAEEIKAKSRIK
ncbi:MAG: VWA domain-containing protein [Flavobacteriaceae bacterium]|nr:VWA domain-containing protein [Flavobacteriaceae bacterium]